MTRAVHKTALIRRHGTLIDVSGLTEDRSTVLPLDKEVNSSLQRKLQYWHHGNNELGEPVNTLEKLYEIDSMGRILTGVGFTSRITKHLNSAGYSVVCQILKHDEEQPAAWKPNWAAIDSRFQLREFQRPFLEAVVNNWSGLLQAPPGFGKSFMMTALVTLLDSARIHIVVCSLELVQQLVAGISRVFPGVGQVGGGVKRFGEHVTVISADSLHLSDGKADFLFCDEVHRLAAPSYSEAIASRYGFSRNFGVSATLEGRFDNAEMKLECLFGPAIFRVKWREAEEAGVVAPIRVLWVPVHTQHNPIAGIAHAVVVKRLGLWRNHYRNNLIAGAAKAFAEEQVLIMVDTVEHAVYLGNLLPDYTLVYKTLKKEKCNKYKNAGLLPSSYKPLAGDDVRRLRGRFASGDLRKVIATNVWGTGVDFPMLRVLIRADGKASKIADTQIPGRASRTHSSKECGYVIDFTDTFDDRMLRRSQSRRRSYAANGWQQQVFSEWMAANGQSQHANV